VKCTECGYESNTIDPFLDISLEINRAHTLDKALQRFTATEYLEGANKYKCPRQACLVRAAKRMAIEEAPNVLCIQLKRFEFSMYGQKVVKKVPPPPAFLLWVILGLHQVNLPPFPKHICRPFDPLSF
jgi:ubiquitin carboxyl-terminal hydrolase 36/42